MVRFPLLLVVMLLLLDVAGIARAEQPTAEGLAFFEKQIRPVLISHCYECHSADAAAKNKLKGGLSLDTREGTLRGGESGVSVVPGKPQEGLLLDALRHDGIQMPPSEKLPDAVIADFEKWISMGAPDPREGVASEVKKGMSIKEARTFWSFISPKRSAAPTVEQQGWSTDGIDLWILAGLESQGLAPLEDTDPRTFVRRLSFDLIGLPPSKEDLETYLADPSPQAREQLVDKLLASPHFGERWGRHWLDGARYADSNGRDRNILNFHAWRYRNYVIDAFNQDKPVDRFIQEQVAGDLLPADATQRDTHLTATAFLALGAKAFEELKPEIFRMDVVDEQIELVGRSILGLSIGCARCHDHKFDPIPTADYYALAGIFRSTQPMYGYGPAGIKANLHVHSELHAIGSDAATLGPAAWEHQQKIQELTLSQNQMSIDRYRVVRNLSAAKLQLEQPGADKPAIEANIAQMEAEIKDWDIKVKEAKDKLAVAYDSAPPQPAWSMGARERETAENCAIHIRGETTNLGETVPRGMLQAVVLSPRTIDNANSSGRLELAQWLTHRDNPLTARVYVNRVWQHLFGRGLVSTPDDFGVNGARPTHPELLDDLAVQLMEDGWSVKRLIRRVVLSRTYRLSSQANDEPNSKFAALTNKDPDNLYCGRVKPRRMEAEVLRDAVLHASGKLVLDRPAADQSVLAQLNPYRDAEYRPFAPAVAEAQFDRPHRSIYLPVIRGVLPEFFQLFDFASPERPTAQREESTVPAQSLYFMNNPWVIGQANALAQMLLNETMLDDRGRVSQLYERVYSRPATEDEITRAVQYLSQVPELKPLAPPAPTPTAESIRVEPWTNLCQIILASAEFRYVY